MHTHTKKTKKTTTTTAIFKCSQKRLVSIEQLVINLLVN